jgi:small subunit ribosomal protein S29
LGYRHPVSPYTKRSETLLQYAQGLAPGEGEGEGKKKGGLQNLKVPEKFSVEEAQALFGVWKDDLALTNCRLLSVPTPASLFAVLLIHVWFMFANQRRFIARYDESFMAKYVESDGNPRDFVWKGVLASYAPS